MSAMERFRLMQGAPSFLPFPAGLVPHPATMHPLLSAGARYPAELLHQYPYISPGAQPVDARTSQTTSDRSKSEEDRLHELEREKEREKEKREKELEKEREREREVEHIKREKQREAEREKHRSTENRERKDILSVPSRYLSDRDGERERESRSSHHHHHQQHQQSNHQHHHHHQTHSLHRSKGGSISQGTPREHDSSSHHHSSRPTSGASDTSHDKNHYFSSSSAAAAAAASAAVAASHRNHDHYKFENHSLPKPEQLTSESSRHAYHHTVSRSDQSKGQPPPLVSPHKSSSKGSGENAIFRPFENDTPLNSATVKNSEKGHGGGHHVLSSQLSISGDVGHYNHVAEKEKTPSLPSNKRMFGSGPEGKLLNSNVLINHRIEKFDFKSLARECSTRDGVSSMNAELPSKPAVVEVDDKISTTSVPPVSLACLPSAVTAVVAEPPLLSRLDARERLLSKARAEGRYHSESEEECELEEEEERRRDRLTVVGSMVPVEVVVTAGKSAMMDSLGLVTQQCKKDMQQRLFRKRRKAMRERSVSPIEVEDSPPNGLITTEPLRTLPPAVLEGEENSKEKIKFLLSLHLMAVPPEQRREREEVRMVCEQIRRRRSEKASAKIRRRLEKEQQELLQSLNQGCSRRKRKYDEIASETTLSLDATVEPLGVTLSQLQERHQAVTRLEQQRQQQRVNHTYGAAGVGASTSEGNRTVIFPEGRDRQLSREFAEQFHESVLQSTRQKEHLQKLGQLSHGHHDAAAKPAPINHHLPPSMVSPAGDSAPPFVWPGIEKVLESYMHHRREQQAEKRVLMDKCCQLRAQKVELTKSADTLYSRIEVLREEQKRRAGQREQMEDVLSNLKKCLTIPR